MSIAVIINCDKCKKEISSDTQTVFVGKLLDVRTGIQGMDFLTGAKLQTGNKPVFFQEIIEQYNHKWDDPESRKDNMEYDLLTTDWILEKVRSSKVYAQNLYCAMCNNDFIKREMWPLLKEQTWSCSWRYAGGIIANMRQQGDYID